MMKAKILVTGGAGYIGSHTVVELVNNGFEPIIVDDFRNSDRGVLNGLKEITGQDIQVLSVDICDKKALFEALEDVNALGVIHFAAYKAVGESVQNPLKYYENNIGGLVNMLAWSREKKINNFIFSSSCTVYGEPKNVKEVSEEMATGIANSPYGETKVIGETILRDFKKSGEDMNIVALRYFNPIGAHPSSFLGELPLGKPNNLLPYITQTAIGIHHELTVFGNDYDTIDGTCVRDYIHVVDLAIAHVKALQFLTKYSSSTVEFVNVGTGKGTSVLEMIQLFEKVSNQQLGWKFGPRRDGDVTEIYANPLKANNLLGWIPKYSVEDAVLHAWNWEQKLRKNE
ncbi:MAG: UDP-glucose 4-epimerase GalE [Bacteroidota bacterium]